MEVYDIPGADLGGGPPGLITRIVGYPFIYQ